MDRLGVCVVTFTNEIDTIAATSMCKIRTTITSTFKREIAVTEKPISDSQVKTNERP